MKKKLWLILAMLALCVGMFALTASAASEGGYVYTVSSNGEATITDVYVSFSGDVTIPSTLGGYPVTAIGLDAFFDCDLLTSVTIPDSVTYIGEDAFFDCNSLTSVTIGNSVTSIGYYAFSHCDSLTSVTIGNSVTSIGSSAFAFCVSLTSVTIPDSVTYIGEDAFFDCNSLTSVEIPDSVTSIGSSAFAPCDSLVSIAVDANNPRYSSMDGVLFNKDKTTLIQYPAKKSGVYTIPNSVTSIGSSAFYNCDSLTSVNIPDSVTSIGSTAFASCDSLTSVNIPDSVTSIGSSAFYNCDSLTSVNIPDSVTSIGSSAFASCDSLTSVNIPDSVTSIGSTAFASCDSLTSVNIPDSVTSIGSSAFSNCSSLTSVTIPDSVTSIGDSAFAPCKSLVSIAVDANNPRYSSMDGVLFNKDKTTLIQYPAKKSGVYTIPNSVTSIGSSAFSVCSSLTSVTIGDSVTSIGSSAFSVCSSLTSVTIGDSVTSIGSSAFSNCNSLTSVTIPDSVISIGTLAFYRCTSLKSATILTKDAFFGATVFTNTAPDFTIHAYAGSTAETYASKNNYKFVEFLHVCDFTAATRVDESHPHAVYAVCSCGEEQLTAENSTVETCTVCRPIQQMLASMTLGNELALNFFFYTSELGTATDYTAVVTKYNGDGTTTEITVPYSAWVPNSTKYMKFTFNGISAKEMADRLEVRIYNGDGQLVSKVFEDSIKAYITRKLPGWWGADAVWAVETLNYGAAAQLYFGYNTANLANANLTEAQRALAPEMIDMPDISENSVATLVLKKSILLKMWFSKTAATNTTGMYATVSYTDHTGEAISYTVRQDGLEMRSTYVIVPIDTIVAADGNTAVTVTLYNADGTVYGTMVDSIVSYASRKASTNELFEAVARFCTASYNYFH